MKNLGIVAIVGGPLAAGVTILAASFILYRRGRRGIAA